MRRVFNDFKKLITDSRSFRPRKARKMVITRDVDIKKLKQREKVTAKSEKLLLYRKE